MTIRDERESLDRQLMSGIGWTAFFRWSSQIISWFATAVAARLLAPGDYGIVSMAMLAVGLVRLIEDFGLDAILVQDRSIVGNVQARLAGLVILVGATLSAGIIVIGRPMADFFNEPEVSVVVSVLGALTLIEALQVVPRAVLQRELEYRKLGWAQFVQVVVTQSVVVLGAFLGWRYWALVSGTLTGSAVVTLLLIAWRPYSVRWPHSMVQLARPLLQGWRMLASRVAWYGYTNADQVIIGRMLGKDLLGAYSFAATFSTMISQEISSVVSKVVPGVFSSVQERREELRRYFLVLTEMLAYLTLPVSFGLAVTSDLMVQIILGPQWNAVIVPLQVLCSYAAFYSCQVLIGHVLLWTGQFRTNMWLSVLAAVLMPVAFYIGAQWSIEGIAWAWVIVYPLVTIPAIVIAFRTIEIKVWAWLNALLPALAASIVMVAAVLTLRSVLPSSLPPPAQAVPAVVTGCLIYVAVLWFFFRRRVLELVDLVRAIKSRVPAVLPGVTSSGR